MQRDQDKAGSSFVAGPLKSFASVPEDRALPCSVISRFTLAYGLPFSSISICSFLSVRRRTKMGINAVTVAVRNSAAASAAI